MTGQMLQDIRYAARGLRRNRVFAVVAILSMALGIGATTGIFSVVDRILFRSLPFGDAERLVSIGIHTPVLPYDFVFGAAYLQLKRHLPSTLEAVTSWSGVRDCDISEGQPVRLSCAAVEASFLQTLGVQPILGRNFDSAEDLPTSPGTVLISYAIWHARFGGRPDVLNQLLPIDGRPARIVGVLPRDFETPTLAQADLLVPQQVDDAMLAHAITGRPLRVIARFRPRAKPRQVQAETEGVLAHELATAHSLMPKSTDIQAQVRSLRDLQVGDARIVSRVLLGTVFAVLLLACANVANLLLARSFARRREMGIRAALGASRRQLLRLALVEGLMLALAGGTAGTALGYFMLRSIVRLAPEGIPRLSEATLDLRVLAVSVICSLAAGMIFAMIPASRKQLSRALVAAQFALSLALLTGAGLLGRALWNFEQKPLGIETQHVLTATLSLPIQRYPQGQQQLAFAEQLEEKLRSAPGIGIAAVADSCPPGAPQRSLMAMALRIDGRIPETPLQGRVVWRAVAPEYFHTLGIPMRRGRGFTEDDRTGENNVTIVSESLARHFFGTANPVGHFLGIAAATDSARIIGVAQDVRNSGGTAPDDPEYYVPRSHSADAPIYNAPNELRRITAIVRTPMAPDAAANLLRRRVAEVDATLPVEIATVAKTTARLSVRPRFNAMLLGLFAAVGLGLAAFGLYGVLSFVVAQRTREIGIRMAIGATPGSVVRTVLMGAGGWLAIGLGIGLWLSAALSRALQSMLLGISPFDPMAWSASAVILLAAALVAAWVPARRAAAVDPMQVLRHE